LATSPRPNRDLGLDLLRGLALVRVIVWHATSAAVVTLLAAMPLMFFVSGELFGRSADRHGAWRTTWDRVRRIGPPLWAFALVAWVAMAVGAHVSGTSIDPARALWWFLPLTDPAGSTWEGGWLATPLWYLRTLLWVLLLAPLLTRAVARAPRLLLAAGVAIVVGLEWVDRVVAWHPPGATRLLWQLGDVALYGTFFAVGMASTRWRTPPARPALLVTLAATTASVVWWVVAPPPGGVVNDSHTTHLLAGAAVVALAMAARPGLARVAEHHLVRPVVHVLGQRSLTIYLWHTTAIAAALWALSRGVAGGLPGRVVLYAALVVAGTIVLTAATGWIEDWAAGRPRRLWPTRRTAPAPTGRWPAPAWWRPVLVPAAAVVVVAAVVPLTAMGPPAGEVFALRVPSQAPPVPVITTGGGEITAHAEGPLRIDPDALDALLDRWATEAGVGGAVISVSTEQDGVWSGAVGHGPWGPRSVDEPIDIASVTKLFTANLVYRVIDAGLIGLDDPLPALPSLPDGPLTGRVTVRQLLSHRSGLPNYRETERYLQDPSAVVSPFEAVAVSLPGDGEELGVGQPVYSSTNYLILGYLLEDLTGTRFEDLLRLSLLEPAGLSRTTHMASAPGEPRFATAGIVSDVEDLARAGQALLVDHIGITDEAWRAMSSVDTESGLGAGTMQFCPCTLDGDGNARAFAIGYASGNSMLVQLPRHDLVVALDLTDPFYGDEGRFDAVQDLLQQLVQVLEGASMVEGPAGPGTEAT
jgi:CubicO group peptidase (beta-lactamase class C family)/peptidoglycan/LPS O-acetylase OafA/YrhL